MGRGFWEHLLVPLTLPVIIFCCSGGAESVRDWLDALSPKLGTGIGLFISATCAAFYPLALASIALNRGEPVRVAWQVAALVGGSLVGGAGLTWLILDQFPDTNAARSGGLIGVGMLLIAFVVLPITVLENRHLNFDPPVETEQERVQRLRTAELMREREPETPDA